MSWSAAEITALASKAARGAGAPAAQATRFGRVVALHLMAKRPIEQLQTALNTLPDGAILDYPLMLDQALSVADRENPKLLRGEFLEELLTSYVEELPFLARVVAGADAGYFLSVNLKTPQRAPVFSRIAGCSDLITHLSGLAEKTYVPESEASRHAGAGAGLTDND